MNKICKGCCVIAVGTNFGFKSITYICDTMCILDKLNKDKEKKEE